MKRILVIGRAYPHAAHNYLNSEVDYLSSRAQVLVLSPNQPRAPFYSPVDFNYFDNVGELVALARQFKPDFIISWLLPNHCYARQVADALDVPFVLKLHTPDRIIIDPARLPLKKRLATYLLSEQFVSRHYLVSSSSIRKTAASRNFKGVYCIPLLKEEISRFFPPEKVFDLQSRLFFDRFHDESPNGDGVMVLGSLLDRREGDAAFARIISAIKGPVDWYPMPTPGCLWINLPNLPANLRVMKYVPPSEMPALYKKYKALIQIGRGYYSRGISMSVIEAQASGVAVVAPSLRPDYDAWVENGGGHVFHDESEIPGILERIPDPAMRQKGFNSASQHDMAGVEMDLAQAGLVL
ncbi:glycosyltransferase family protein [Ferribacterium limneticum]|uniref:hypothetical protein n=1 Tax=Ferribacterium limneticum TaxID=76259 RepID=UPI001CFC1592|nr:hypothetical protein [Ferribacterium limneticum]UCV18273.1 hypothetical protein KI610_15925 [Ferribacterium limneticum]